MQKLPTGLIGIGLLFLSSSILLGWLIIPYLIETKIEQQVRLINGTETFEKWSDIKLPIYLSFYIFNVTNAHQVTKGSKPILEELGPYVYEEKRTKVDISIDEKADTVTYRQPVTYFFRPDFSNGTETDNVTIINVPLVGLSRLAEASVVFLRAYLNLLVSRHKQTLFVQKGVGEILFDGYFVNIIDSIQKTTGKKILPNSTFGFYYGKNGTDDGLYEVYSGASDSSKFGQIYSWNNQTRLTYWGRGEDNGKENICNMINGTDGSIFSPFVTKDRILRLFNPDLCRSLHLRYKEDVKVHGVTAYRFTVPRDMLESPNLNENNACFCVDPNNCGKSGVILLASCRNGAPVVASTPHFLDGDEFYVNQSIGLSPDRAKHQTLVDVEPNTGLVLRAIKRIQINIELIPTPAIGEFKHVPKMMFPVFWAEESGGADEEGIGNLSSKLILPLEIIKIGKWSIVTFSCILILMGSLVGFIRLRNRSYV